MPRMRRVVFCEFSDLLWAGGNIRVWDNADPDAISVCFIVSSPVASVSTSTAQSAEQAEPPLEQDLAQKVPNALALEGATTTYSFLQAT